MKKFVHNIFVAIFMCATMFIGTSWADPACTGFAYYDQDSGTCVTCATPGFTIRTTSMSANTQFLFSMSAKGSFAVDWGDGNIENIDRDNTTATEYSHTYTTSGVKDIKFCGLATEYNSAAGDKVVAAISFYKAEGGTQTLIASVTGSLGTVFPTIGTGTNANQQPRFRSTFQDASNLTTIPAGLFSGVFGSADGMFRSTFDKCTKLTKIPDGLFANATGGAQNMFHSTFYECKTLTKIPDRLFAGITQAAAREFKFTFYGTSGITTYIPSEAFAGLIANPPSSTPNEMWNRTFDSSGVWTQCQGRTQQYTTGLESNWAGRVSCEPTNPCKGTNYWDSVQEACVPCPTGYDYDTTDIKESVNECQIQCAGGTYIAHANDTVCTNVGDGYYAGASSVNYGSVGTRSQCPNGQLTGTQTATNESQCQTSCQGATYYDSTTEDCEDCPTGYTDNTTNGKNSINQCQRHCAAGSDTETYTPILYLQSNAQKQYIDTGYEITGTHVYGTAVVGTETTRNDPGYFFGNVYGPGGFSSNYKKGVFGLWMQPTSGTGAKAQISGTFNANTEYTVSYDVSLDTNTNITTAVLNINNSNNPQDNTHNSAPFNGSGNTFKLFTNGAAHWEKGDVKMNTWDDKFFTGRIYSLELYDDGIKVLDLIPVRRESDGALGMFNRVNNEFYGNAGKNNFTAGADNGDSFVVCSPVGNGYYVPANDTNYGSNGTRNRCPNDSPTMVNDVVINNASSIYQCDGVEPCEDATYPNLQTGVCTACPTGYDFNTANGKEYVQQCQTYCAGGTYLATTYDPTCTDVGDGYYADASTVNWGSTSFRTRCENGGATGTTTATDASECQAVANCTGATYMNLGVCAPCPTGYDDNTVDGKTSADECQLICPEGSYLATANATTCTDAGVGYWATGGAVNYGSTSVRTACATGLTTVGYGHGADESADCGRILHVGDNILYSKRTKPTTPALNIQVENDQTVYYLGAETTNHSVSTLHVNDGNQQYTVFDDSLLYGERNFNTNARIQQ